MGLFDWLKKPKREKLKLDENPNRPTVVGMEGRGRGLPGFTDLPTEIFWNGYDIIYEHDCTFTPLQKRSQRCSKFAMHLVGSGDFRNEMQKILDETIGLPQILEFLSYSDVEGFRLAWLKTTPVGRMNVLNFLGAGGRKLKAGGDYWWGGYDYPDVVRLKPQVQGDKDDKDATYEASRFIIFTPSGDINPEGDTRMGLNMLRVASLAAVLDKAEYVYTERHSLPREVLEVVMKKFSPSTVAAALSSGVAALVGADAMDVAGMNAEQVLKLLEPSGKTWAFLDALREKLESRAHKLVTGENKSSGSGGNNDVGIPDNAEKQFMASASRLLNLAAEEFTNKVIPFLAEANSHFLPARKDEDGPLYIEFRPVPEKNKLSVAELCQLANIGAPIAWNDYFSITGLTTIPGVEDEFGPYYVKSMMNPGGKTEDVGVTDSGNKQRKDRMEPTKQEDKNDKMDMRNVTEDDMDTEDEDA
jgi:hypothetical protein